MSERGWTGEALFVYQDAAFVEVVAHDNGYIYGQLPPGHTHANRWVRLNRSHEEWRERRAIAELLGETS